MDGTPPPNAPLPAQKIAYTIAVADIANRRFHVTAVARELPAAQTELNFAIPAWSPGWYVLTHAYANIHNVAATGVDGGALAVTHLDPLTWRVAHPRGAAAVSLSYDVTAVDQDPDALDLGLAKTKNYGFFTPYLDASHGFAPGPAMLMYVVGGKTAPCTVSYAVPVGWQIASANDPVPGQPDTFSAPNYDTLADQPADLGHFERFDRKLDGVPVSVLVVGADTVNASHWVDRTFKIAQSELAFWGDVAPFPRYLFQFRFPAHEQGGGGLEHLNGTVITLDRSSLTQTDPDDMELVAHEMFHAWNVKRAHPVALGPFDYTQPVRVKDLWWSEGVTDYFAPQIVVDSGIGDLTYWRGYFTEQIEELQHASARRTVTLEEASLKAWEGKSEGFGGLSYYNKGEIVALLLDIEMRHRTGNRVGLVDVMKALYRQSVTTGHGWSDGEIERQTNKLTGSDFHAFFDAALRGTSELPYASILPAAGLTLTDTGSSNASNAADRDENHHYQLDLVEHPTPEQAAILRAVSGSEHPQTP